MTERIDWRYYLDFWLFPPVAALLAFMDYEFRFAWFMLGVFAFTFVEYWTHRSLLHRFFWHGTHERHHLNPTEHVIFPIWYTPAIFTAMIGTMWAVGVPLSGASGFVVGYLWFMGLHHLLHHVTPAPGSVLERYAIWHNRHHKIPTVNYGITHPLWDWVFGTYRGKQA